ncbi:uncharacterized protein LOC132911431 [Bombus pascuorum]|uniref:uncharacterized protein LOC132911431 n=1 Tax=Bombus pascuorum TaxID=65598 RepID=UPI00298DD9BE|nr:uncharacterized protein LOC132911431 [Bombus pascuorum]
MTPLLRWVLLALLLAMVVAHPVEHACVYLCRTRNTSPEITGGCEHQQKLVLQSSGGRFLIHRLFRLCLTPCHGSSDLLVFDNTRNCRTFRETLIRCYGCSCDDVNYGETGNNQEDPSTVNKFEEDQLKETDVTRMLEKAGEQHIVRGQSLKTKDVGRYITEIKAEKDIIQADLKDTGNLNKADSEETPKDAANGNLEKPGSEDDASRKKDSTDETSVDWDRWCMNQCDNGKGGSACKCDIIP